MDNATSFGTQADTYSSARPLYPHALLRWIAEQAPARRLAWDVGCGSGQAARALSTRFAKVLATDIDPAQIKAAPAHPSICFRVAPAHLSGLDPGMADAVNVGTALHWFDLGPFWEELRRVARKDATFCAWTYHRAETEKAVCDVLMDPVADVLEPYWSDGNRLSWRGYDPEELGMPFEPLPAPDFACELRWSAIQIAGFLRSWSAHAKARADGHGDVLAEIERNALDMLGDTPRQFDLPLHVLAATIR